MNTINFSILPTDKSFKDSPNAGNSKCICSRCGKVISEEDAPAIRSWTTNEKGDVDENSLEYRYHINCLR